MDRTHESLSERFRALVRETSTENWDTFGADPIRKAAWDEAERFARVVSNELPGLVVPFPSPGADGGVNLRWSDERGRLIDAELLDDEIRWTQKVKGVRSRGTFVGRHELIAHLRKLFSDG
jgi:hypothetical protein